MKCHHAYAKATGQTKKLSHCQPLRFLDLAWAIAANHIDSTEIKESGIVMHSDTVISVQLTTPSSILGSLRKYMVIAMNKTSPAVVVHRNQAFSIRGTSLSNERLCDSPLWVSSRQSTTDRLGGWLRSEPDGHSFRD